MRLPYVERMTQAIAAAPNELAADALRAELASYYARQGRWDDADRELAALHAKYDPRPNASISALLNLAEGHMIYFRGLGDGAVDKVRRAYALSAAVGNSSIRARAAAWLANFDFASFKHDSMARYAIESLNLAGPDDHAALCRVSVVIAQALHYANRAELAMPWYRAAHRHAVAERDDSMTSILLFNMASIRTANLRLVELSGANGSETWSLVNLGAESSQNLDAGIGTQSLDTFTPLLRAQLFANQGRWDEAADLYSRYMPASKSQGLDRLQCWYTADLAWCQLNRNDLQTAADLAGKAATLVTAESHTDDVAAMHSRLSSVWHRLGDAALADSHAAAAQRGWAEFRALQASIVASLDGLAVK